MLSKTDIKGLAIRMLTLACYFLPFVFCFTTCVDGNTRTAYNRADAIANEKDKVIAEKKDLLEATANLIAEKITVSDSAVETTSETIKLLQEGDDLWFLNPTITSLSAIGFVLAYENPLPRVIMGLSVLISLLCFLLWPLIKRKNLAAYFLGVNLVLVLLFLVYCVASNISVLFGAYVLVFLLLIQLFSILQDKRNKINPTLGEINPN